MEVREGGERRLGMGRWWKLVDGDWEFEAGGWGGTKGDIMEVGVGREVEVGVGGTLENGMKVEDWGLRIGR